RSFRRLQNFENRALYLQRFSSSSTPHRPHTDPSELQESAQNSGSCPKRSQTPRPPSRWHSESISIEFAIHRPTGPRHSVRSTAPPSQHSCPLYDPRSYSHPPRRTRVHLSCNIYPSASSSPMPEPRAARVARRSQLVDQSW